MSALWMLIDGEHVPVCRCTVDSTDGGIFVSHESAKPGQHDWHRIATLDPEIVAELNREKVTDGE